MMTRAALAALMKVMAKDTAKSAAKQGAKREVKYTFRSNPGKITEEHQDELIQLETEAMRRVARNRAAPKQRPTQ